MRNIFNLIKQPKSFFENLSREKIYISPFFIIITLYLLSTFITKNLYSDYLTDIINSSGAMQNEELDVILRNQTITSFIINPILPLIIIFVKSYLLNGISYFDGYGELKDSINVVSFSYIVVALGNVINSLISLINRNYNFSINPTLLFNFEQNSYFYNFLSGLTLFVIYYQILLIIGISVLYKVEKKRAAVFVIGTWITWLLLTSGIKSINI
ncbi:MAG: YIP1 family protein [Bacillota bacterium]|nr:YIP1 family protein [Bacillota bacterium]